MRDSANEVLRAIATDGPVSRAQLARDLGLSGPTLTQATKYLLDRGLIVELDQTASTGGRRATLLGLVAGAGQILGVKLAEDHLVGVCIDMESRIQWKFSSDFNSRGEDALEELYSILKRNIKKVSGQLLGIGIGVPGVVSPGDFGTTKSAILGWNSVNVGKVLSERLSTPVLLENDVNTLAIDESLFGRGKDTSNFLTITFGRGIGMGIVINGELYAGSHGAGEIGHVTVSNNKLACECGKYGCLETMASDPAILNKAIESRYVSKGSTIEDVWKIARTDKKIATVLYKEPGLAVAVSLANVINVFGPELVLVSGEGSQAWDIWSRWVIPELEGNVVPTMRNFNVEVDPWDDEKWALGAGAIVLRASLTNSTGISASRQAVKNRLRLLPETGMEKAK
eukprot:gene1242-1257_t